MPPLCLSRLPPPLHPGEQLHPPWQAARSHSHPPCLSPLRLGVLLDLNRSGLRSPSRCSRCLAHRKRCRTPSQPLRLMLDFVNSNKNHDSERVDLLTFACLRIPIFSPKSTGKAPEHHRGNISPHGLYSFGPLSSGLLLPLATRRRLTPVQFVRRPKPISLAWSRYSPAQSCRGPIQDFLTESTGHHFPGQLRFCPTRRKTSTFWK